MIRSLNLPCLMVGLMLWGCLASAESAKTDSTPAADSTRPPMRLCVATFNLRYASASGPNAWPTRRPIMQECLRQLAPDLIGTQEGLQQQLQELAKDLPDYGWIGAGRDGGNRGEFMAIFYRRARFNPLSTNHFWLSDTPDVAASTTWGNSNRRMVTWVRFRESATGREFFFWNTHFDHEVELAREKSAKLIRERISALPQTVPLILTGDFNCNAGASRPYEILTRGEDGLADTWTKASHRVNEAYNSFQGFREPQKNGDRIDWTLTRGEVDVEKAEVVTYSREGQFPSDHFPVATWLTLP